MCIRDSWNIGIILVGISCWVLIISDSVLFERVKHQMEGSLEHLRKKQDIEIQELLYYLRESKLGNNPWSNLETAKNHIRKISFPAIITDAGGACVALNPALTDTLGYGKEHIGQLCHGWQTSKRYGEYVQGIAANITNKKRFMHSRLTMIDVDGGEHVGTVAITMLPDMRTAVGIWYPDANGILKNT